jgi:hypothetical protein
VAGVGRSLRLAVAVSAVAVLAAGCSDDGSGDDSADGGGSTTSTTVAPTTTSPSTGLIDSVCAGTAAVTDAGTVGSPAITEASGLAASRRNPGVWWTHNDSGGPNQVFALSDSGAVLSTITLTNAENRDWEDIAVGPPSGHGGATLYVADSGDNTVIQDPTGGRGNVRIYRLPEPEVDPGASGAKASAKADTLTLTYPDGPHDSEAFLVDPVDGDLIVITKDWTLRGEPSVYRASGDVADGSTVVLQKVGVVPGSLGSLVTAADVSPDGSVVGIRTYEAVRLYRRPTGEPLWAAFESTPCEGPTPRPETQGEALGFAADGASYVTVSEGTNPVLHRTAAG